VIIHFGDPGTRNHEVMIRDIPTVKGQCGAIGVSGQVAQYIGVSW
jgi:hypothetical protein